MTLDVTLYVLRQSLAEPRAHQFWLVLWASKPSPGSIYLFLPRIRGSNDDCLAFQWVQGLKLFLTAAFPAEPSPQFLLCGFFYSDCYSFVWDHSAIVGIGHTRGE